MQRFLPLAIALSLVTAGISTAAGSKPTDLTEATDVMGPPPPLPPHSCGPRTGGQIRILSAGNAYPYPSTCVVSGLSGSITDVNVTFEDLNHTYPDMIDMLLVSPGGQNAIFFSDAGGFNDAFDCDLLLDDEAATVLPNFGGFSCPGSYSPANYEPKTDSIPAPAPSPSGSVDLSTFDGGNPNGTWRLYIVHDGANGDGYIRSWSLAVTTGGGLHSARSDLGEGSP